MVGALPVRSNNWLDLERRVRFMRGGGWKVLHCSTIGVSCLLEWVTRRGGSVHGPFPSCPSFGPDELGMIRLFDSRLIFVVGHLHWIWIYIYIYIKRYTPFTASVSASPAPSSHPKSPSPSHLRSGSFARHGSCSCIYATDFITIRRAPQVSKPTLPADG